MQMEAQMLLEECNSHQLWYRRQKGQEKTKEITEQTQESAQMEDECEMDFPVDDQQTLDVVMVDDDEDAVEADDIAHMNDKDTTGRMEVHELTWGDESTRRKERRLAQSKREREGDIRRKEGRPRHFLTVDEYTRKPHGVGVGDWRKELMLLSRNLDPAINNINNQPSGAVAEIAEWIQHTWKYSVSIRFEYVKQVIARGVNLRRSELWKRIRNDEPKPEKLIDRSWRILRRQLESPATTRITEACSRANAMRVNFGRTGPSREVGVRERLRNKLRRSPDPEEIQSEMARDKGYGGHSQRKKQDFSVMHESGGGLQQRMPQKRLCRWNGNASSSGGSIRTMGGHLDNEDKNVNLELDSQEDSAKASPEERVLTMSEEQILHHPLVMKLMQRLDALEGQNNAAHEDDQNASHEDEATMIMFKEIPDKGGRQSHVNVQDDGHVKECRVRDRSQALQKSGRRKSRAMHIA